MLPSRSTGGHVARVSTRSGGLPSGAGRLAGILVLLSLPLAAAGGAREILVGAAASLAEPIAAIAAAYEAAHPGVRVRVVLGASNALAAQMRAGAPLEILVAADPPIVDRLAAEHLVAPAGRRRLAGNRLAVLVRAELAGAIRSASDLARPEIRRIAVPNPAVPVGRHGREWLAARGLLATLGPRVVASEDARATLAVVDAGNADAAIVYATDARLATSARVAFEIPAHEQPEIVYEAALRAGAGGEAGRFFAFLAGPEASRALAASGFAAPPGAP
jgi:molybdate transport system substrate-binding protein